MGGNALKVNTRRYSKEEYFDIVAEVLKKLNDNGVISFIPKSYTSKDSFGDLDVLILAHTVPNDDVIGLIQKLFSPNEIFSNNNVKSFDYKEFQVDFIVTGDENFDTSKQYFSYNDLGNFIGRISYQMGFRYGHYGLKLVYRHDDGGRKFSKIISKDSRKIYEFLGLSFDRYKKGFDNLEDVFEFVVNSKYFNPRIFDYDQLNHQNKTRNKKRKNYELFLEYVKKQNINNPYEYKSKDNYLDKAENFFDINLRDEINEWKKIIELQKEASKTFNGNVVMEHFPLNGKELGVAMGKFNKYFDSFLPDGNENEQKTYRSKWIIDNDLNTVLELFKKINNL